jgi:hypothetical protein
MRDMALYSAWRKRFPAESANAAVEIQDWLRSGWLRITYPSIPATDSTAEPPFDPFGAYAHDEDSALSLMAALRKISLQRPADAIMLRKAVSNAICAWDFLDETVVFAIRFSFRVGAIFGCAEVCDRLVGQAQTLVSSPRPIITGLSDMAATLGTEGRSLVERLIAVSCESYKVANLPYLLVRLIELSSQAEVGKQRDLILDAIEKYGYALQKCGASIDALEALTDVVISELRLIEGVLNPNQLKRLDSISVYLDSDAILSIPQLREAIHQAPHQANFIEDAKAEAGDLENLLLES